MSKILVDSKSGRLWIGTEAAACEYIYMKPIVSRNLAEAGYSSALEALFVRFKTGALYRYDGVSLVQYLDLTTAPSAGKFLNASIKPAHPADLLEAERSKR